MASNSKQSKLNETKFTEATKNWNLEKLYEDLRTVKQKGSSGRKVLTGIEKCHLRGLLCGYSPEKIANERGVVVGTVNDALSKTLYCYIKELLEYTKEIRHWGDVPDFLEKAGYKIQVSEPSQSSNSISGKQETTSEASKQLIKTYMIQESFFKLSSQNPADWLSAVLSLQEIASRDNCPPDDSWRIMICLADFIRKKARRNRKKEEGEQKRSFKRLPDYIQEALTVIGQRDPTKDKRRIDLRNIDIRGANLMRANLSKVMLDRSNLQGSKLQWANLQGAWLSKANLQEAILFQANLQGAYLISTNLQSARLSGTNLQEATLWKANLQEATLEKANLQEAILWEANLSGAKKLTSSQVESAEGDNKTLLPNNLELPILWEQAKTGIVILQKKSLTKFGERLKRKPKM